MVPGIALNEGGFVNLNSGIRFITNEEAESLENLVSPTIDVLLQIPEVQKEIETFYQNVWGDDSPEEGNYDETLIDLFGSKATFFVPRNHQSEGARIEGIITCSCTSGTSGCTLEEIKKLGQVIGHKCKAGACTTCQMNYPEK